MPIMAAHGQNDARVATTLLASTAVECLRDPKLASNQEVALNNVYRLLESFRINPFFGLEPPNKTSPHAAETLAFQPLERHVSEVSNAMAQAISASFAGESTDEAIEEIEDVLRGISYPQQYAHPSQDQLTKATDFFVQILNRLNCL